jgi:hypothetical protein
MSLKPFNTIIRVNNLQFTLMTEKHFLPIAILALCLSNIPCRSIAQVSVNGPTCVLPGVIYQYTFSGNWNSSSVMQVCLTGGKLSDSGTTCTANGAPIGFVRVIWDSVAQGNLQVSSSLGNSTLSVTMAASLTGGALDSASKQLIMTAAILSGTIHCAAASGGACNAHLTYQWQQSSDGELWSDIPGATSQNYPFATLLKQTTYFRRRTTDTASTLISYSDQAMVVVPMAMTATPATN